MYLLEIIIDLPFGFPINNIISLLIVGSDYCVMRFAYALHMRHKNLDPLAKSFELVMKIILPYCTTPPCHNIDLFKRPFQGSRFEYLNDAFVLLIGLNFVYLPKVLIYADCLNSRMYID